LVSPQQLAVFLARKQLGESMEIGLGLGEPLENKDYRAGWLPSIIKRAGEPLLGAKFQGNVQRVSIR
jgi:hypothetical protein